MNNAAMNIRAQLLCPFLLGVRLGAASLSLLPGSCGSVRTYQACLSDCAFDVPGAVSRALTPPHSCCNCFICLSDGSCKVLPPGGFDLSAPVMSALYQKNMEQIFIFSCLLWPLKCLLWRTLCSDPLPVFILICLLLSCNSSLHNSYIV